MSSIIDQGPGTEVVISLLPHGANRFEVFQAHAVLARSATPPVILMSASGGLGSVRLYGIRSFGCYLTGATLA